MNSATNSLFYAYQKAQPDFIGNTLILPSLTIGNIGQLAIDLLIFNSRDFQKVGYIASPYVAPLVGNDALAPPSPPVARKKRTSKSTNLNNNNSSSDTPTNISSIPEQGQSPQSHTANITLSIELFQDAKNKVTILQQRSPAFHASSNRFASQLAEWIRSAKFAQVIILSSMDGAKKDDSLLQLSMSSPLLFRFTAARSDELESQALSMKLPKLSKPTEIEDVFRSSSVTRYLRQALEEDSFPVPCFVLICYCSEGFNAIEATATATIVSHLVKPAFSAIQTWQQPKSWQYLQGKGHEEYNIF